MSAFAGLTRLGYHRTMRLTVALLLTPAAANAASARLTSLEELTGRAELVVVGTAEAGTAHWQGTRIVTETPVRIEEVWAGGAAAGDIVAVQSLGGVVGDIGQWVPGENRLVEGDQVVLFLGRTAQGGWRALDLAQGAFHVLPIASGAPRLRRQLDGMQLLGGPLSFPETLPDLKQAVLDMHRAR